MLRLVSTLVLLCAVLTTAARADNSNGCKPTDMKSDGFGRYCMSGGPATPLTSSDYGVVYVMVTPPDDISEQVVKANKGGWKAWLKRYFVPSVKTGQVVLELRQGPNDASKLIATIPVATFSVDQTKGIKVEGSQEFSGLVQATPYFRLDPISNPIRATFTVRSTNNPSSKILDAVTAVTKAAVALGGHGWLVSAVSDQALQTTLGEIQSRIVENSTASTKVTTPVTVSFETNSQIDYVYGLNPKGTEQTGRVHIRLVRRPSMFTGKTTAANYPDFGIPGRTDLGATQTFLGRPVTDTQTVLTYLTSRTAGQMSKFQQGDISVAEFNSACSSVKNALGSPDYPLNMHDIEAVLWAAWVSGQNDSRQDIQSSNCMSSELPAFKLYGLMVQEPPAPPPPPPVTQPVTQPPKPDPAATGPAASSAQLNTSRLKIFIEDIVMKKFAQVGSSAERVNDLSNLFWDQPHPMIEVETSEGISNLTSTSNGFAVAEKLAAFQFRPGCYYRDAADQTVRFLARVVSPTVDAAQPPWIFVLKLSSSSSSLATTSNTRIAGLTLRTAGQIDYDAMKKALPDRLGCHSPDTAPA